MQRTVAACVAAKCSRCSAAKQAVSRHIGFEPGVSDRKRRDNMKKIGIGIITAAVLINTVIPGFADVPYNVEYDWLNNGLVLNGDKCTDGDYITVQILKKDKSFDSFNHSEVLYGNQTTVKNGAYDFNVRYNTESGIYNARIVSSAGGDTTDFKVVISTKSDMETIYSALNSAAEANDIAAFNTAVNENIIFLAANPEQTVGIKSGDYFNCVKKNRLSIDNIQNNTKVFNTFLLMESLSDGSTQNLDPKIDKISIASDAMKSDYKKLAAEQTAQEYFTAKMSKKQLSTVDDFNTYFRQALILTAAKYGSGYGDLMTIVKSYGDSVGITDASSADNVYKALMGKEYTDGAAFEKAYRDAVSSDSQSGTSGSSGSSGSSRGGSVTTGGKTNNQPETVKFEFDDIEGVDWASEAIIALADKKIIAGKGEGKFKPNDNITREEFAKILVGAMGYSNTEYTANAFADVNTSDWFCGWVNTAHEKGILNGIGGGNFGVGMNISRQDMCVMLVNAMRIKGAQLNPSAVSFADSGDIADYASDAVGILSAMQIVNGVDGNNFNPRGNATRAQAAKIIYAALDKLQ